MLSPRGMWRCALLVLALAGPCFAKVDPKVDKDVKKAVEHQAFGEKAATVSQIVEMMPAANLSAGTGDIDTTGKCQDDILRLCQDVKIGYGHLAECLDNAVADEAEGNSDTPRRVSPACKDELLAFKAGLVSNINMNVKMASACKGDVEKLCGEYKDIKKEDGVVIACLKEKKQQLGASCRRQVRKAQLQAANDFRLDAMLYKVCKDDAATVCKDVPRGKGLVNACLRDKRMQVSWDCQQELFRADVEAADDIRLSVRLFRTCMAEKTQFCADIEPGNSRVKDCLEDNMKAAGFGSECKNLMTKMIEQRAKDFRLDKHMREACNADIASICPKAKEDSGADANNDGRVVRCLQDLREDIQAPACQKVVRRRMEAAAEDIRFDAGLAESCYEDRSRLCASVPPGSARVIRCLLEQRSMLSEACNTQLFQHEVRASEDIEYNFELKDACSDEIRSTCTDAPEGGSDVLRCLVEHMESSEFGEKCQKELKKFVKDMSLDWRLHHGLHQRCKDDVASLCGQECDIQDRHQCGGKVLQCLTDHKDDLKADACKKEVAFLIKMEVNNFDSNAILAEACRADVETHCSDVEHGKGAVHACLRKHTKDLSQACRAEELKLEVEESTNSDLPVVFTEVCAKERDVFCGEVASGQGRVFRCLAHSLMEADFGDACREEVKAKLARRQSNWRFDYNLHLSCESDVTDLCGDAVVQVDKAAVTRCLIDVHSQLSEACARSVSRVSHMALVVWQPGGAISSVCDADITSRCRKQASGTGAPHDVLECLEQPGGAVNGTGGDRKALATTTALTKECQQLVDIAEVPDNINEFEQNLKSISLAQVHAKMVKAGVWSKREGVTITGYVAIFCFSALCAMVAMGVRQLALYVIGDKSNYQPVVKNCDV